MIPTPSHIAEKFYAIREQKPLIQNITNYVVMDFTANLLLAIGASPAMIHAPKESGEMTSISDALLLNIGTLSLPWLEGMIRSLQTARTFQKPVVLDPVAVGCTQFRHQAIEMLLEHNYITVIKGNASEILALHQHATTTAAKGPDSINAVSEAVDAAIAVANQYNCVVAVTGEDDFVTDGTQKAWVQNGHPLLQFITGTGCGAGAVIASFLTVEKTPFSATIAALSAYGIAAEIAGNTASAPASFRTAFIDALFTLSKDQICQMAKIKA